MPLENWEEVAAIAIKLTSAPFIWRQFSVLSNQSILEIILKNCLSTQLLRVLYNVSQQCVHCNLQVLK